MKKETTRAQKQMAHSSRARQNYARHWKTCSHVQMPEIWTLLPTHHKMRVKSSPHSNENHPLNPHPGRRNRGHLLRKFIFTMKLDTFTKAYITTALWSSTDENDRPLDENYDESDLAPEALASIVADCARFQAENGDTLRAAIETGKVTCGPDFDEYGRAGHDFWLTRNGHGAGFWDGDWPEPFDEQLTEASKAFGECNLYVGDDGKLYLL